MACRCRSLLCRYRVLFSINLFHLKTWDPEQRLLEHYLLSSYVGDAGRYLEQYKFNRSAMSSSDGMSSIYRQNDRNTTESNTSIIEFHSWHAEICRKKEHRASRSTKVIGRSLYTNGCSKIKLSRYSKLVEIELHVNLKYTYWNTRFVEILSLRIPACKADSAKGTSKKLHELVC